MGIRTATALASVANAATEGTAAGPGKTTTGAGNDTTMGIRTRIRAANDGISLSGRGSCHAFSVCAVGTLLFVFATLRASSFTFPRQWVSRLPSFYSSMVRPLQHDWAHSPFASLQTASTLSLPVISHPCRSTSSPASV